MTETAIVIFAYNRADKLSLLLKSLLPQIRDMHKVLVFSDGPRTEIDEGKVRGVRDVLSTIKHSGLEVHAARANLGLARSVTHGLDVTFARFERAIVLEDDLVLAETAIQFFELGLETFEHDSRVCTVQGYTHPSIQESNHFFLRGAGSWGWATWRDRWQTYRKLSPEEVSGAMTRNCLSEVDFDGAYDYSRMLLEAKEGKIDSWAVPWHLYNFCRGALSLYPSSTQVLNKGLDGTGSHGDVDLLGIYNAKSPGKLSLEPWPSFTHNLEECQNARNSLIRFYLDIQKPKWVLRRWLARLVRTVRSK